MTLIHQHIAAFLGPGEAVHLARAQLRQSRPAALHDHDFFEMFWVQNGRVRHHLMDRHEDLHEGDLVMLAPGTAHGLQGRGDTTLVVSLAFHPEMIAALATTHPALQGRLFWSGGDTPVRLFRDSRQLAALNQAALALEVGRRDRLGAEAFLLPLCAGLLDDETVLPAGAPRWLATACAATRDPKVFRDGAAGFVRAAGRAHPHVSRTARRFLGQTPSDYVNAVRMDHAARRLTGTTDTLAEIAAEVGLPNLSHFHKLFRAHHGMTPVRFRQQGQRALVQP
ncbi:MAG: helix-turn-helix domain-containing protein [Limimaricola sp.]|uniref:AraC family transcriptional regulator n=1 Tax=Limimaricola sp. TaxID=2211665 RepID=UPI001DD6CC67|nr:helix-turn-helix transcriptional regulator [Limimaricola sp.]MBI1417648.1 helix-turn-helix domain-containing protein [Limimaricola sp.]